MEELNKQQIVLLTLLVSFVTSIATGITTVSLVTQYDTPTVTQTINRVVEKTIERVVPADTEEKTITVVKTPEKEIVTVVVKEEDLTIDSIQTNAKSLVRIYDVSNKQRLLVSLGLVISKDGSFIARESFFSKNKSYIGVYGDKEYELDPLYQGKDDPIIIMKPILAVGDATTFNAVSFGEAGTLQLGQTVLSLGGANQNEVNNGIIKSLQKNTDATKVIAINTTVPAPTLLGTILINLKGEVVGMNLGEFLDGQTFTPVETIQSYIANTLTEV
jgi:hypothetical protein